MRFETLSRCWGCGQPLPRDRFGPGGHRLYHDRGYEERHLRTLGEFEERHPELPGWGLCPVGRPAGGDVLEATRTREGGRPSVRFVRGPARKAVLAHFGRDTLPVAYYLERAERASLWEVASFLQKNYPEAEIMPVHGENEPQKRGR